MVEKLAKKIGKINPKLIPNNNIFYRINEIGDVINYENLGFKVPLIFQIIRFVAPRALSREIQKIIYDIVLESPDIQEEIELHKSNSLCIDNEYIPVINNREKIDEDTIIITACDQGFLRGAYFMIWTLLRVNDCRVILYNLGFDVNNPMVKQMKRWGVEIRQGIVTVPRTYTGWQTFNKPWQIRDAMKLGKRVLWIDSDISISSSILEATEIIKEKVFVPNHGNCTPHSNDNSEVFYGLVGGPRVKRSGSNYPCAGTLGFDSVRDLPLVESWIERTIKIFKEPEEYNLVKSLTYFDQNIVQDLLPTDLQDGRIWGSFESPRSASVSGLLAFNNEHSERIINHYGGGRKPFEGWTDILEWEDPF